MKTTFITEVLFEEMPDRIYNVTGYFDRLKDAKKHVRKQFDKYGRCITMKIITVKGSEFGENAPRVNRITTTGDSYVMWKS